MPRPRLLLVGAGHAHLEILRRLADEEHPPVHLTVVSASARQLYSGMVPGFLYGEYAEEQIAVKLAPVVERAGGELVVDEAVAVDTSACRVELASGISLAYDLVSFNVGSRTAGEDTPGVREHSSLVKPIQQAVELRRRIEAVAAQPPFRQSSGVEGRRAVVVGGGAAGVEVACALATGLDRKRPRAVDEDSVTLLEAGDRILAGSSDRFHLRARKVLEERGIEVRARTEVTAVGPDRVTTRSRNGRTGELRELPANLTVWLTGAAAQPLFRTSGLPTDDRGFLLVDRALRSPADERVFGAGDCVTPADRPETPKAGVYAVRAAPVLWKSLLAALGARNTFPRYEPQEDFLSILNTADGRALLRWRWIVSHSRWAWWLKDWIDRRFVERHAED